MRLPHCYVEITYCSGYICLDDVLLTSTYSCAPNAVETLNVTQLHRNSANITASGQVVCDANI